MAGMGALVRPRPAAGHGGRTGRGNGRGGAPDRGLHPADLRRGPCADGAVAWPHRAEPYADSAVGPRLINQADKQDEHDEYCEREPWSYPVLVDGQVLRRPWREVIELLWWTELMSTLANGLIYGGAAAGTARIIRKKARTCARSGLPFSAWTHRSWPSQASATGGPSSLTSGNRVSNLPHSP